MMAVAAALWLASRERQHQHIRNETSSAVGRKARMTKTPEGHWHN